MAQDRIRYRKLPGRRRGILMGSSVWLGADHLLLVKSSRFREDYKRMYFRDIQAIVTANAPRFHISSRSLVIGALWMFAFLSALGYGIGSGRPAAVWVVGGLGLALAIIWVIFSAAFSCRCRIFTAVSSEPLPSLYRTWTARRFVQLVEPHIAQVQGVIEGNWVEAAEERQIGPLVAGRMGYVPPPVVMPAGPGMVLLPGESPMPQMAMPGMMPGAMIPGAPMAPGAAMAQPKVIARSRTVPSVLFVAALCLGGAAELLSMRTGIVAARWILMGCVLLQIGTAVTVMVQCFKGGLRAAFRNLAIVMLAATGLWYYAVQIMAGMLIGMDNARHPERTTVNLQENQMAFMNFPWSRGSAGVINILLGLTGAVLLLRGDPQDEPVSFNV